MRRTLARATSALRLDPRMRRWNPDNRRGSRRGGRGGAGGNGG